MACYIFQSILPYKSLLMPSILGSSVREAMLSGVKEKIIEFGVREDTMNPSSATL